MAAQSDSGALVRCAWTGTDNAQMLAYHDEDWGVPIHDDRRLFEMVTLEGAQAGLSWATILKRRESYRAAFHDYDIERIASYGDPDTQRLLADVGIIRNRAKVAATIKNAQATLDLQKEGGSLETLLWSFVGGATKENRFKTMAEIPAETVESKAMSKALTKRGFGFVGPTICYALMQSVGLVNDHTVDCFRHLQV